MKSLRKKRRSACDPRLGPALLLLLAAVPLYGQVEVDWRHGGGGVHRSGGLVPLHVRLTNPSGEDLVLYLEGGWKDFEGKVERRVELAAGAKKEVDFYLGPAGYQHSFHVRLVEDSGEEVDELLFTSVPVMPGKLLIGVVGRHPMGWKTLETRRAFSGKVAFLETGLLPGRAEGLRAFDLLIWPRPAAEKLAAEQVRALAHWVETGGHLVLATAEAETLTPWTTIRVAETLVTDRLESLDARPFPRSLAAARLDRGRGRVWRGEPWGPVAVEEERGRGGVLVLGFDPAAPPLSSWSGLGGLWLGVLRHFELRHRSDRGYGHFPYSELDLRRTARIALTAETGGTSLPVSLLLVLLVLYLALIGPLEYLVLSRFDRLKWTWLSFPLSVGLFSLGSYSLVAATRGDVTLARHILVRDLFPPSPDFCEELHASIFASSSGERRLVPRLPRALPVVRQEGPDPFSQRGFPSSTQSFFPGGGGAGYYVYQAQGSFSPPVLPRFARASSPPVYEQGAAAVGKRLSKWSFLAATFVAHSPAGNARVESELAWNGDRLAGRITTHLGTGLSDAWLLLKTPQGQVRVAKLGPLDDGVPRTVHDPILEGVDGRIVVDPTFWRDSEEPLALFLRDLVLETSRRLWSSRDFGDDPHPEHDWSDYLGGGGAVLIGWVRDPEPRLLSGDEDASLSGTLIYRVAVSGPGAEI